LIFDFTTVVVGRTNSRRFVLVNKIPTVLGAILPAMKREGRIRIEDLFNPAAPEAGQVVESENPAATPTSEYTTL
jgi:hypothetical protein